MFRFSEVCMINKDYLYLPLLKTLIKYNKPVNKSPDSDSI